MILGFTFGIKECEVAGNTRFFTAKMVAVNIKKIFVILQPIFCKDFP